MSLKNVELQVALPRTIENSRNVQNQLHQHNVQSALNAEDLANRTRQTTQTVSSMEENARTENRERERQHDRRDRTLQKQEAAKAEADAAPHPYKGHVLDIKM